MLAFLEGDEATALSHGELEEQLQVAARELFRRLSQDHLDPRALNETCLEVVADADGVPREAVEAGHERALTTVFGQVKVGRLAYHKRGHANLHPADGVLNLPQEKHSHGLRRLAALEPRAGLSAARSPRSSGLPGNTWGKRQAEALAARPAVDFHDFYAGRQPLQADPGDVSVLSCDGKGIVMRPGALRPATRKATAKTTKKLATRLSKGEKRNRKRIAEVGSAYDLTPVLRIPADVLAQSKDTGKDARGPVSAPKAKGKWLTASVTDDAACVTDQIFDETDRRDPDHSRAWVALVDGNNHQIERITAQAAARGIDVTIVADFFHVLEYPWHAAWSFHDQANPAGEAWVHYTASRVLAGKAKQVAGIRGATRQRAARRSVRAGSARPQPT